MCDFPSHKKLEFYEGYESFCFQNCLRILLQYKEIDYPELYVNGALVLVSCWNKHNKELRFSIGNEMRGLLPSVNNKVIRIYCPNEKPQIVFEDNMKLLKEKGPLIVGLDTYYMPYAINYKTNHAIHTAILTGFDLEKKHVSIIDWYKPWFFCGEVDVKNFLESRGSDNEYDGTIFSGVPIENNYAYVNDFEEVNAISLLREMLSLSQMNNDLEGRDKKNNKVCYGVEAYRCLKEKIFEWYNELDAKSLHSDFFGIWNRYKFFLEYIIIAEKYVDCNTRDLTKACSDMILELDAFRMLLMKMQIVKNERNKERLILRLEKIILLQLLIQSNIESILKEIS